MKWRNVFVRTWVGTYSGWCECMGCLAFIWRPLSSCKIRYSWRKPYECFIIHHLFFLCVCVWLIWLFFNGLLHTCLYAYSLCCSKCCLHTVNRLFKSFAPAEFSTVTASFCTGDARSAFRTVQLDARFAFIKSIFTMAFHLIHIKNEANKSLNRFGLTFSLKSNPMNGFYTPSITFNPIHKHSHKENVRGWERWRVTE